MKHVFKTLASAFAIVAAASCAKEITPAEPSEIGGDQTAKFELTVTTDQNTKAAFDSDVRQLTWQEGDQIAVFDGTAKQVFTVVAESIEGGSAKFVGDITEGATELYVAYPVAAASAASAEGMTVTIPSEQTVPEGAKADPEAFVMVGKVAADRSVELKNVVSLVKCTLENAATSVSIVADSAISGDVTANPLTGVATAASAKSVKASGSFEAGSSVYIAVAPATVEGFKVVLRNESGRMVKSTTNTATFKQNGILAIGTVDAGAVAVPDEIANYDQYKTFVENHAYYSSDDVVKIVADINIAGKDITAVPSFTGTLDGGNHKLSNITITNSADEPVGLFSTLTGATVKDLVLENINVSSTYVEVGGLVGNATDCTIENVSVTGGLGSVITTTANFTPTPNTKYGAVYTSGFAVVGGIVGAVSGGVIKNCNFEGTVSAANRSLAGIAGFVDAAPAQITNCSFKVGALVDSSKGTNAAGIVGISISSDLKIEGCTCFGTVKAGYSYVGGIASAVTNATITNCLAQEAYISESAASSGTLSGILAYCDNGSVTITGCNVDNCTIKGGFGLGGVLGHSGDKNNTTVTINDCHVKNGTTFESLHTSSYSGGLVGRTNSKTQQLTITDSDVKNCTLTAKAGGQTGGIIGCSQAVTSTLTRVASYGNTVSCVAPAATAAYCAGVIGCQYGANSTFTDCVAEKIEISAPNATNSNSAFFIGRPTSAAKKIELINPVVRNCTLSAPAGQTNGGLVGYLDGESLIVKNAVIDGISIDCVRRYVGGVVGNIVNTVKSVSVDGLKLSGSTFKVTGTVSGENQNYTGGVVGYMSGTVTEVTIKNAELSNTKFICNRAYVGGLLGTCAGKSVIVENSVVGSSCSVTGSYSVGGLTGGAFFGNGTFMKIDGCTCYAQVTGSNFQVGGLVGLINNNALTTRANVVISNSAYIGGSVVSTHAGVAHVGGIIGKSGGLETEGENNRTYTYVVNCFSRPNKIFASAATPLAETSEAYVGGIMGHLHSGMTVYGCYCGAPETNIAANGLNAYPIWGVAEDFSTWHNKADKVYYGNGFTAAGYFKTAGDAASVTSEAVPFTDGTLLTKLNAAASAYNAAPLYAGSSADQWIAGSDGYPTLAKVLPDPDKK